MESTLSAGGDPQFTLYQLYVYNYWSKSKTQVPSTIFWYTNQPHIIIHPSIENDDYVAAYGLRIDTAWEIGNVDTNAIQLLEKSVDYFSGKINQFEGILTMLESNHVRAVDVESSHPIEYVWLDRCDEDDDGYSDEFDAENFQEYLIIHARNKEVDLNKCTFYNSGNPNEKAKLQLCYVIVECPDMDTAATIAKCAERVDNYKTNVLVICTDSKKLYQSLVNTCSEGKILET